MKIYFIPFPTSQGMAELKRLEEVPKTFISNPQSIINRKAIDDMYKGYKPLINDNLPF